MTDDLESQIRESLRLSKLPIAPDHLRQRVAKSLTLVGIDEPQVRGVDRNRRGRPWLLLPATAILMALAGLSLLIPGSPPPTVVDGLPVLSVSEVLAQRAAGGLRDQPVAVGGYWSYTAIALSCAAPNGRPGALEIYCYDGLSGITERNEPIFLLGRYVETTWQAKGPHLTPYVPSGLAGGERLFGQPTNDGQQFPPIPIVVVGHFDDRRAADCRPEARQLCLDRLVVDRIVYFNPGAASWAANIPTREPSPPPAPSHY